MIRKDDIHFYKITPVKSRLIRDEENHMNISKKIMLFLLIAILLFPAISSAQTIAVTATGEYIMGDNDTFTEGKKLALQDAKRLALEKVGTYIESTTEVKNGAVSSDEVKQYTAGIIKVEVVDEKRSILDSKATVVKVTVSAAVNPDDVVRQVMSLQKRKEVEEKARKLSSENERLRNEITLMNEQLRTITDAKKNKALRNQREEALQKIIDNEKGLTVLVSGEYLVKASLYDRQKKKDDRQFINRFLHEIAGAYQITSDEPEVEDNGDGTSNVIIRYNVNLPGQFDLRQSVIDVSSIDDFLAKGFIIKAFSNGGLIVRCADYRRNKCNTSLSPHFDNEVLKMHISIKLGEYIKTESIGMMESAESSKNKSSSSYRDRRNTEERPQHYIPPVSGAMKSPPVTMQSRWQDERSTTFQNPEPSRIRYPLIYKGSYTCVFKNIPHSELQKVSKIEIKVIDK
ncbi:MAG: hypothetical protein ABFD82_11860 [Syntrophaceae bacterium]